MTGWTTSASAIATGLPRNMASLAEEAAALRQAIAQTVPTDAETTTIRDLHAAVTTARGLLDRIEAIQSSLMAIKRHANLSLAAAKEDHDDAWTEAATTPLRSTSTSEPAPRERYAAYDMQTLTLKRTVRAAERAASDIVALLEWVNTLARGAADTRRDLLALLQTRTTATRLDS
jgi:hypothetical protein